MFSSSRVFLHHHRQTALDPKIGFYVYNKTAEYDSPFQVLCYPSFLLFVSFFPCFLIIFSFFPPFSSLPFIPIPFLIFFSLLISSFAFPSFFPFFPTLFHSLFSLPFLFPSFHHVLFCSSLSLSLSKLPCSSFSPAVCPCFHLLPFFLSLFFLHPLLLLSSLFCFINFESCRKFFFLTKQLQP